MADLRKLKDRAAELAALGKLERAAETYREILAQDPKDVASLQRLAEVQRRAGDTARAIASYRAVADRYGRDGLLIKAIAICKIILELDPAHAATQAALAELYAGRARTGNARLPQPPTVSVPAVSAGTPPLPDATTPLAEIVSAARAAVEAGLVEEDVHVELEPLEEPPESALPRVPIFSDLSREAFRALADGMVLLRFDRGRAVLAEGEDGKGFFVVASGRLAVSRRDERGEPVVLARLVEGDFFGEMALLSGAPRSATVTAEEPSEVLELPAGLLLDLARRHPHLARSLQRFYRRRLIANALAVSPVFRPFGREERKHIMERFRAREVRSGEVVIREGAPSDGLYVVLEGAVDVVKRLDGRDRTVGLLREGDLFGEVSCLRKAPATATVRVRRAGTLLRLPRSAFDELVVTYPQILEAVSELSDERLEQLDAILSGHAQWTEEGLVLI